jgi:hypothetical protein
MDRTRGQVIAIANAKGGVGQSTLGADLTWALATQTGRRGQRCGRTRSSLSPGRVDEKAHLPSTDAVDCSPADRCFHMVNLTTPEGGMT